MKRSTASRAGIAVVILVLAGGAILQWRYNQRLRGELIASRNELAQARQESAQLKQRASNGTAEAQSTVDNRELLRLRNRIAEMGRQLRHQTTDVQKFAGTNKTDGATENEKQYKYPFLKTAVTNRVPNG